MRKRLVKSLPPASSTPRVRPQSLLGPVDVLGTPFLTIARNRVLRYNKYILLNTHTHMERFYPKLVRLRGFNGEIFTVELV